MHCANQGGNYNKNQRSEGDCNERGTILITNAVVRKIFEEEEEREKHS